MGSKAASTVVREHGSVTLTWHERRDSWGARQMVADTEFGRYTVDGNGAGRMRWSVFYPGADNGASGYTDTREEAFAWAAVDYADRRDAERERDEDERSITRQPVTFVEAIECTACGENIETHARRRVVAMGRQSGFATYAIVHDLDECENVISGPIVATL